jgi:hypothetical protein
MKPNIRFLSFVFWNLVYISLMILIGYNTWTGKVTAFFGILLLIILLLRWPDLFIAYNRASAEDDSYSIDLSLKPAINNHVTPEFITEILGNPKVIQVIKNDLLKTSQIGYKEEWRLGLITPDQDRLDPNLASQIPLRRTAVLHSTDYFKHNNIVIVNGAVKPLGLPKWSCGLSTKLNRGEFISIRSIQVEEDARISRHRSQSLPEFLREDGFPLKESYADGDPLTTVRGGTIVIDHGKAIVIYPRYFMQRRLIDDAGNLVDLGIDENFRRGPTFEVAMQPSLSRLLMQRVSSKGYIPVVRYRSFLYTSEFMLPILDTPMSCSGWADLFVDPTGRAKLFIAREKTEAEWYEMMNKLRQLLSGELAKKDYHLLGLTKDRAHLDLYLAKKQRILEEYFIVQDWKLV